MGNLRYRYRPSAEAMTYFDRSHPKWQLMASSYESDTPEGTLSLAFGRKSRPDGLKLSVDLIRRPFPDRVDLWLEPTTSINRSFDMGVIERFREKDEPASSSPNYAPPVRQKIDPREEFDWLYRKPR